MSDVDVELAPAHFLSIESLDGAHALLFGSHDHESEASRAAGMAVEHHFGRDDRSVVHKQFAEVLIGLRPGDVSDEEFGWHVLARWASLDCTHGDGVNSKLLS